MEQGKASIVKDCARVEPQREISQLAPCCLLTVKLRGRTEALAWRRGRKLSSRARGAKQEALHGPLQRLLGAQLLARVCVHDLAIVIDEEFYKPARVWKRRLIR